MCDPVAQDYHGDARFDDLRIADQDRMLRHCRTPVQIVPCAINGKKVSDRAFCIKKGEVGASTDIECLLAKDGFPPEHRYGLMPNTFALIAVNAADARDLAGGVAWTPKPEERHLEGDAARAPNPWHGEIVGPITNSSSREFVRRAGVVKADFDRVP